MADHRKKKPHANNNHKVPKGKDHPLHGRLPKSTKYTDVSLLARICLLALKGNSRSDCFRIAGIHPDTGFQWLAWGREESRDPVLARFERVFERCFSHYNAQMVASVDAVARMGTPSTWTAAMTMLERRDPQNWGKRDTHKIEGGDKPLLQLNQVVLADTETRELSRALLRRVAGPDAHEPLGSGIRGELESGEEVDSR